MKNIITFGLIIILISCQGEQVPDAEIQEQHIEESGVDSTNSVTETELIDSNDVIPNTDWATYELKGRVEYTSESGFVLEDGEELIMTSYYETNEFDRNGKQTSQEIFGSGGLEPQEWEYVYNDQGQLSHRILYYLDENDEHYEEYDFKEKYFYNEEGVLVKVKMAGFDKELVEEHIYKFNTDGELIEKQEKYTNSGDTNILTYEYEEKKKTVYRQKDGEDAGSEHIYTYDDNGLLVEHKLICDDFTLEEKYTYEYDEYGNWIKQEVTSRYIDPDGVKEEWKKSYRTTRKVKYFITQ